MRVARLLHARAAWLGCDRGRGLGRDAAMANLAIYRMADEIVEHCCSSQSFLMSGGNQKGVYRILDIKPSTEEHKVTGMQPHARRNKLSSFPNFITCC